MRIAQFLLNLRPCFTGICLLTCLLGVSRSADAQLDGQMGHTALPTVGRNTGITHLELFPYVMIEDEAILFGNVRGFVTNEGNVGGNFGGGFRILEPNDIVVLGANAYYDADQTSGQTFQQLGFGLEALARFGTVTSNFYFPVGDTDQRVMESRSPARFSGNQVLFDNLVIQGEAMPGLDLNLSWLLPGDFAQERQLELTTGWYHFQGDQVDNINGFRIQVDGEIVPTVNAHLAVTSDDYFGPNATLGISWRFGNRDLEDNSLDRQLRRFVRRNYNVIVGEWAESGTDIPLVNPLTGNEYVVQHVSAAALSGAGTFESPFPSLSAAQTAGGDIFYVHAGTTLTESISLTDGQMLLGGGTEHWLTDQRYGEVLVPEKLSKGATPTLLNSPVDAVTLANNSRLAGFVLNSPNADAIVADGISDFDIYDITILNGDGDAIVLNDTGDGSLKRITITGGAGNGIEATDIGVNRKTNLDLDTVLEFEDIFINGVAGNGIQIQGGQAEINFLGDVIVDNVEGSSFFVADLITTEELIDDQGTTTTVDDEIEVHEGIVTVENLEINAADGGVGIDLQNNDGLIGFGDVDITTTNATGVSIQNSNRVFTNTGAVATTGAAAVDLSDSLVDLRFTSISADGGANGIRMVNTDGLLIVFGDGSENSGGTIQNTDVAVEMTNSGQLGLQTMLFENNNTVGFIRDSTQFEIGFGNITSTNTQFINAENLRTLIVASSNFTNNTLTEQVGIDYVASTTGGFITRFNNNLVTEGPEQMLRVRTVTGGEGASLTYTLQSNDIDIDTAGGVAAEVDWLGPIQADVRNNLIQGTASNQTGLRFIAGDSNDNSLLAIQQNGIALQGASSKGIEIISDAPMITQINQNVIQFAGLDGVGISVTGNKVSTLSLFTNDITDFAGGATAILFPTLFDGSVITLNDNLVDLTAADAFVDRGIILNTVGGIDDPFVEFRSSSTNIISGASTIFSAPPGQATGQVIINGQVFR